MALTHCHECGKDISNQALSCPHCGAPRKKKEMGCISSTILMFFAVILVKLLSSAFCGRGPEAVDAPYVEPQNSIPEVTGWRAQKTDEIPGIKVAYDITINRKMSHAELMAIAQRLKSSSHQRTFMCYRFEGLQGMCWATTHANPEIEIMILGGQ